MRALARRACWNLGDQALFALTNMLLMVLVARRVDAHDFGAFAVGFLVYGIAVAVAKAVAGQPLQIRYSAEEPAAFRTAAAGALGGVLWLGLAGGVVVAALGLLVDGSLGAALLAVAATLAAHMIQDTYRMAFFAIGKASWATLIDAVKAVVQFGLLFALFALDTRNVGLLTLAWGIAALVSSGVGAALLRCVPRPGQARGWAHRQGSLLKYLLAEYTLGLGASQLGGLLIPVLGTQRDSGAIRGAQTLLGPLNVLGTAGLAFTVPEVSRRAQMLARRRVAVMSAYSLAMGVVSIGYVVVLLLLPEAAGRALFADTWSGAATVLVPMGLVSVAAALGSGPGMMLLGMGLAQKTFRINVLKAPLLFGLLIPGTLVWGGVGAAWAMAIVEVVVVPFWVVTAWRAAHGRYDNLRPDARGTAEPVHGPPVRAVVS